jgi:hypothetical protein
MERMRRNKGRSSQLLAWKPGLESSFEDEPVAREVDAPDRRMA